jgi:hypothetical protein
MMHTNLIERLQYAMDLAAADGVNAPSGKHWELAGRPDLTDYEVNIEADRILALAWPVPKLELPKRKPTKSPSMKQETAA